MGKGNRRTSNHYKIYWRQLLISAVIGTLLGWLIGTLLPVTNIWAPKIKVQDISYGLFEHGATIGVVDHILTTDEYLVYLPFDVPVEYLDRGWLIEEDGYNIFIQWDLKSTYKHTLANTRVVLYSNDNIKGISEYQLFDNVTYELIDQGYDEKKGKYYVRYDISTIEPGRTAYVHCRGYLNFSDLNSKYPLTINQDGTVSITDKIVRENMSAIEFVISAYNEQ